MGANAFVGAMGLWLGTCIGASLMGLVISGDIDRRVNLAYSTGYDCGCAAGMGVELDA